MWSRRFAVRQVREARRFSKSGGPQANLPGKPHKPKSLATPGAAVPSAIEPAAKSGPSLFPVFLGLSALPPALFLVRCKYDPIFREQMESEYPSIMEYASKILGPTWSPEPFSGEGAQQEAEDEETQVLKQSVESLRLQLIAVGLIDEMGADLGLEDEAAPTSLPSAAASTAAPAKAKESQPKSEQEPANLKAELQALTLRLLEASEAEGAAAAKRAQQAEAAAAQAVADSAAAAAASAQQAKELALAEGLAGELLTLDRAVAKLQDDTVRVAQQQVQARHDAARQQLIASLARDLSQCSAQQLRQRVADLVLQLAEVQQWEAVRVRELLDVAAKESEEKSQQVLQLQAIEYRAALDAAVADAQAEAAQAQEQAVADAVAAGDSALQRSLREAAQAAQTQLQAQLEEQQTRLTAEWEAIVAAARNEERAKAANATRSRITDAAAVAASLQTVTSQLQRQSEQAVFSRQVHRISLAVLALSEAVQRGQPLGAQLNALQQAGQGDYLVEAALASLPARASAGVSTMAQLQKRYVTVHTEARRAALVPEGGGMLGHALGHVAAAVTLKEREGTVGDGADARCARAEALLRSGDLGAAVLELEGLTGYPADTVSSFLADAKARLAVDQLTTLMRAHVSALGASLSC